MPNYDYVCEPCDKDFEDFKNIEERELGTCPDCSKIGRKVIKKARTTIFREGWYEHLSIEPIYISSKRKLLDECKRNDVSSTYYG